MAQEVRTILGLPLDQYLPRHASYDLKKLRGKQWIHKIGNSRRYVPTSDGLKLMTALLTLREKVIKPVFAGAGKPQPDPKPKHQSPIDVLYQTIQMAMHNLFQALGIAI